ncbi:reverse transcriptase family protein [Listeria fleischmannii]|uniref:RNA-directed DNA polymerase n=1 Tax=Listeria fleischmannii TaxID=1069827 RepID=A0A841YAU7_9LIST|nr:reverse transcriptase family protein [Listeria fleischmannii]MBC1397348.1 RNA-directed DNA polymerase [Listeria fleischmannii]MBC1425717.1 RNA-directed DNA polymerase [Listeria fleischmannii]
MNHQEVFGYATEAQLNEFLYSFQLLGQKKASKEKQLATLYAISNHLEDHYKTFSVQKRNGQMRIIYAPSPLLKGVQRRILTSLLNERQDSPFATAYKNGESIFLNAAKHARQKYILKLDIEDFFGSILFPDVMNYAFPKAIFPKRISGLLTSLCCYHDALPQGAPTSAAISNIVMKPFDDYMGKLARDMGINYSRYSDDMTFSGDFDTAYMYRKAKMFLNDMNFSVNHAKTKVLTRKMQQKVTGLIVNEKIQVPKAYRKKVRQDAYYASQFGLRNHLAFIQQSNEDEISTEAVKRYQLVLLGKINHILCANPNDKEFLNWREKIKGL